MDNSTNLKLLSAIKTQLDSLEDSFYDGIPRELLKNTHLRHFSNMMIVVHSKIITLIRNSIQEVDVDVDVDADADVDADVDVDADADVDNKSNLDNINIDYSQLDALSKKD